MTDRAGNITAETWTGFSMSQGVTIGNQTIYVRPVGAPRNAGAARGSSQNAHATIQDGIDAAAAIGGGSVIITNGTYPITTPIHPKPSVSLIGESVGKVILNGQGNASLDLLLLSDAGNDISNQQFSLDMIANLTFINARAGIVKSSTSFNTYNFTIANCIFYQLSGEAIKLENLDLNAKIIQNTIYDCGSGIILTNYPNRWDPATTLDDPAYQFQCRNNLVLNTLGTGQKGIELTGIRGLRTQARNGWNDAYGFKNNFGGSDDYSTVRLPGEISAAAILNRKTALDFSLHYASRGAHEGDPLTEDSDGSRRDMGAVIDSYKINGIHDWNALNY